MVAASFKALTTTTPAGKASPDAAGKDASCARRGRPRSSWSSCQAMAANTSSESQKPVTTAARAGRHLADPARERRGAAGLPRGTSSGRRLSLFTSLSTTLDRTCVTPGSLNAVSCRKLS
jgi:hypothetical protein